MPFSAHPASSIPPVIAARQAARCAVLTAKLAELYPEPASIIFEIGCGHGHFLAAYAAAHPEILCLGVDLVTKRIERANRKQTRLALKNLAFLKADAAETLASLPDYVRLSGVFVLFPEPWPKQRHHHRRLLQSALLDTLASRAVTGSWLALRTDDKSLFTWSNNQISSNLNWVISPQNSWPFEHTSYFQEIQGDHQSLVAKKIEIT